MSYSSRNGRPRDIMLPLLPGSSTRRETTDLLIDTPPLTSTFDTWQPPDLRLNPIFDPPTPTSPSFKGVWLQSLGRQLLQDCMFVVITSLWCIATALYTYNASTEYPKVHNDLFTNRRFSLTGISALAQVT